MQEPLISGNVRENLFTVRSPPASKGDMSTTPAALSFRLFDVITATAAFVMSTVLWVESFPGAVTPRQAGITGIIINLTFFAIYVCYLMIWICVKREHPGGYFFWGIVAYAAGYFVFALSTPWKEDQFILPDNSNSLVMLGSVLFLIGSVMLQIPSWRNSSQTGPMQTFLGASWFTIGSIFLIIWSSVLPPFEAIPLGKEPQAVTSLILYTAMFAFVPGRVHFFFGSWVSFSQLRKTSEKAEPDNEWTNPAELPSQQGWVSTTRISLDDGDVEKNRKADVVAHAGVTEDLFANAAGRRRTNLV